MNEQNPGVEPVESTSLTVPYKDRSTGLMIFGILTVLLGCLAGLGVRLMLLGQAVTPANAKMGFSSLLPVISIYVVLGIALVWLGIGSIMARRWARALLLIFSWSWLALGLVEMVAMAFIMPKVLGNLPSTGTAGHPALAGAAMDGVLVVMFLIFAVMFVILPAIWTFFYSSRHVKATCDARNPMKTWTDACPLPVLGLCLWAMFSVPMMLLMPIAGHCVAPFFGIFLTGVPAGIFYLALAALWTFSAELLYKLDVRGWWLILIAMCAGMASSLVTFAQHDIMEMYRLMNYPEAQMQQLQKFGLFAGNGMLWMTLFSALPFFGYLLFIKRYFRA
jgi:hypothetical protein